ncbi:hypothetical protein ASC87_21465 [Rhizobacter sp. Root1221]|nr:hypothetical protein ASC87_21465 [Rhizobacter sp. Root1221]
MVVADGVTVTTVWSVLSVTVVVAVPDVSSDSKLPPVRPVTVTFRVSVPCTSASSARTANGVVAPVVWPTGMVMVWPLLSVSTTGEPCTALLSVAV